MGEDSDNHNRTIPIEEVQGKHIMNHDHDPYKGRAMNRNSLVAGIIVVILVLAGITALTLWLVYRPHKPKFEVLEAAILTSPLNNTSTSTATPPPPPYLISTSMQFIIASTNPNKRVSIYYDHMSAYVTYINQMITKPVPLPTLYHHKHSTVQLAPILGGEDVPVSREVINGLGMDEAMGVVGMRVVLLGRLRWKAGAIITSHYHVYIHCDVLLRVTKGFVGQVTLLDNPVCKVDV